jgi:hypothetical protein
MAKIGPFHKTFGPDIEIFFWLPSGSSFSIHSRPHVREVFELSIQGDKGFLLYDGYHRIENHPPPYPEYEQWNVSFGDQRTPHEEWLPQDLTMIVYETNREKKEQIDITYHICGTKREIIECTDVYSKDVDPCGEEMEICYFPTNKQKLYFDILRPSIKNEQTTAV